MANQTQLTDNNSDNVSFVLTANTLADNPGASNNDPSTFNIRFNGTPNNYLNELGIYDAYCLQPWIPITNGTYPAEAYYSTEDFTIDTFADIDNDGNINELFELTQDSLQASVFTLNNLTWEDLDSDGDLEGIISDGQGGTLASGLEILDIQLLIWYQLYGLYAPDFPEFDETPYGDRSLDQASNESLAMSIEALATNYVPEKAGDQVGVILIPTDINPSNPDPNAGGSQYLLTTIELSGLGDYVWFDTDEDGIQDLDEKGIEGVTVQLLADLDDNGQIDIEEVLETTTTDANGFYSFDGIVADDYQVRFIAPDNLDFTQTNAGGNDNSDSDANSNGLSQIINLTPGEFKENIDAGLVIASELELACLGNYVFIDNNNNGIQDRSDTPLSGVTVELLTANGELVDSTITIDNGFYFFNSLIPGDYQVQFIAPQGFNFTTANMGNDNLDSDADSDGLTAIITLTSGQNNFSVDAGLVSENLQPGIEIEKFTNGVDADTPEEAVEILPGQPVTWTYQVSNMGNSILTLDDILVTDDNGTANNTRDDLSTDNGLIVLDISSDDGHDGILSAHETWIYTASGIAQNLMPTPGSVNPVAIYKNIGTVNIEGATDSDASHYINPELELAPKGDMTEILGKPQALTFTYIPSNTVQTSGKDKDNDGFGDQDGKAKIESGFPDNDHTAYIVVANKKELDKIQKGDAETYFAGNVEVGKSFTASVDFLNGKNVFDDNTYILVLENEATFLAGNNPLQVMKYRTKDDQPIEVGDVIGSVQVVEYFGEIGSYDNTHIEAMTGEINRGFQLNEILGKPLALTFEYNNGDTLFTNQKDKDAKILVNNRIDDDGTSYIIVTDEDKANDALAGKGQEYFAGYVSFNSVFEASVTNAATDKFEDKTYIHYFDDMTGGLLRSVQYKTKGDKDIHLGDDLSGLEIVGYVGEDGSTGIVL